MALKNWKSYAKKQKNFLIYRSAKMRYLILMKAYFSLRKINYQIVYMNSIEFYCYFIKLAIVSIKFESYNLQQIVMILRRIFHTSPTITLTLTKKEFFGIFKNAQRLPLFSKASVEKKNDHQKQQRKGLFSKPQQLESKERDNNKRLGNSKENKQSYTKIPTQAELQNLERILSLQTQTIHEEIDIMIKCIPILHKSFSGSIYKKFRQFLKNIKSKQISSLNPKQLNQFTIFYFKLFIKKIITRNYYIQSLISSQYIKQVSKNELNYEQICYHFSFIRKYNSHLFNSKQYCPLVDRLIKELKTNRTFSAKECLFLLFNYDNGSKRFSQDHQLTQTVLNLIVKNFNEIEEETLINILKAIIKMQIQQNTQNNSLIQQLFLEKYQNVDFDIDHKIFQLITPNKNKGFQKSFENINNMLINNFIFKTSGLKGKKLTKAMHSMKIVERIGESFKNNLSKEKKKGIIRFIMNFFEDSSNDIKVGQVILAKIIENNVFNNTQVTKLAAFFIDNKVALSNGDLLFYLSRNNVQLSNKVIQDCFQRFMPINKKAFNALMCFKIQQQINPENQILKQIFEQAFKLFISHSKQNIKMFMTYIYETPNKDLYNFEKYVGLGLVLNQIENRRPLSEVYDSFSLKLGYLAATKIIRTNDSSNLFVSQIVNSDQRFLIRLFERQVELQNQFFNLNFFYFLINFTQSLKDYLYRYRYEGKYIGEALLNMTIYYVKIFSNHLQRHCQKRYYKQFWAFVRAVLNQTHQFLEIHLSNQVISLFRVILNSSKIFQNDSYFQESVRIIMEKTVKNVNKSFDFKNMMFREAVLLQLIDRQNYKEYFQFNLNRQGQEQILNLVSAWKNPQIQFKQINDQTFIAIVSASSTKVQRNLNQVLQFINQTQRQILLTALSFYSINPATNVSFIVLESILDRVNQQSLPLDTNFYLIIKNLINYQKGKSFFVKFEKLISKITGILSQRMRKYSILTHLEMIKLLSKTKIHQKNYNNYLEIFWSIVKQLNYQNYASRSALYLLIQLNYNFSQADINFIYNFAVNENKSTLQIFFIFQKLFTPQKREKLLQHNMSLNESSSFFDERMYNNRMTHKYLQNNYKKIYQAYQFHKKVKFQNYSACQKSPPHKISQLIVLKLLFSIRQPS